MGLIPDEAELKVLKLYLPYVLIIVQSWMIYTLANTLYNNANAQITNAKDREQVQREEKYFWRNSFLELVAAYQKLPLENPDDSLGDHGNEHHTRNRRKHYPAYD